MALGILAYQTVLVVERVELLVVDSHGSQAESVVLHNRISLHLTSLDSK